MRKTNFTKSTIPQEILFNIERSGERFLEFHVDSKNGLEAVITEYTAEDGSSKKHLCLIGHGRTPSLVELREARHYLIDNPETRMFMEFPHTYDSELHHPWIHNLFEL